MVNTLNDTQPMTTLNQDFYLPHSQKLSGCDRKTHAIIYIFFYVFIIIIICILLTRYPLRCDRANPVGLETTDSLLIFATITSTLFQLFHLLPPADFISPLYSYIYTIKSGFNIKINISDNF